MECPNCKHATSNSALLQCSHCGEAYERGPLEEYEHLEYLADWLADRPEISFSQKKKIFDVVEKKQDDLLKKLLPQIAIEVPKPVAPKPAPIPVVEMKPVEAKPIPAPVVVVKPAPVAIPKPIPQTKPVKVVMKAETTATAPVVKTIPASKPRPVVAPKPIAPPKPPKPPIDWRKVITDAATSGALLRALLYLGAFMIVVSAAVLVIRYCH